jgi:hypothetical protein
VQAFYTAAADGDYDGAWSLLADDARAQFGGDPDQLRATFDSLERVEIHSLDPRVDGDRAQVALATTAYHRQYVDECSGSTSLGRGEGGWHITQFEIGCDKRRSSARERAKPNGNGKGNGDGTGNGRGRDEGRDD